MFLEAQCVFEGKDVKEEQASHKKTSCYGRRISHGRTSCHEKAYFIAGLAVMEGRLSGRPLCLGRKSCFRRITCYTSNTAWPLIMCYCKSGRTSCHGIM
jgi:hypothetical protein